MGGLSISCHLHSQSALIAYKSVINGVLANCGLSLEIIKNLLSELMEVSL